MKRKNSVNHGGLRYSTRVVAMLLCVVMILGVLPVSIFAADIVDSGYCGGEDDGKNLTWTLDTDGVLTISGEGVMRNYSYYDSVPWYKNRTSIRSISISAGVTTIGNYV